MTWVKICATTNLDDALASVAAGADALGFIFAPSTRQITVEAASEIIAALPPAVEKIGVFVNQAPSHVAEVAGRTGLTGVQLHGDEPAEQIPSFRRALGKRKIIKTLQARQLLNDDAREQVVSAYLKLSEDMDAILLDSGSPAQRGGTGIPFDWEEAVPIAGAIRTVMPLIIAGGLNADNVSKAIRLFKPFGVDVVSGVERSIGKKDETKLCSFLASVRLAEQVGPSVSQPRQPISESTEPRSGGVEVSPGRQPGVK